MAKQDIQPGEEVISIIIIINRNYHNYNINLFYFNFEDLEKYFDFDLIKKQPGKEVLNINLSTLIWDIWKNILIWRAV